MFSSYYKPKRILVTGASGCIGHYVVETLIQETDYELFLLVRDPEKLRVDLEARSGIEIIKADMRDIDRYKDLLATIDIAILAATAWGGSQEVFDVNVLKTLRLIELLDPEVCEQVIYFSTASILDRNNELLREAGQLGTDYIRSKFDCIRRFSRLPLASRITTLYPTLVFGGDEQKPLSHLTAGVPQVLKWINLIRFFKAEGSFHFIHARDIAKIVLHLVENPPEPSRPFVLGNAAMTVDQAVEEICAAVNKSIVFRIPLTPLLADIFITLFRIQMSSWDEYCLKQRHFTYTDPVTPATFGMTTEYPTLRDTLKASGYFKVESPYSMSANSFEDPTSESSQNEPGTGEAERDF
ncbi:NAD-dependent epimerase/dehydratase family protein [Oxynema aestuarii]|uniref:NAD(P)-dependent oxidoreductase n=1 Tax=Oxynema aestuarii AP17 TaxID=2064643 RepID=A0A6H1TS91_9CYAN|nr:NAD(P)-dependent oxidoreductase [Oxynema aestuarii]QIZ69411.1 NAD(P)-dependent oxidoreductase [Oxynema aestuarii AP17]RMH75089.1 MAG: NAD(P)-dependent oxidoreductase [Cyanobacteria bacterium J007]